jgi:hypothetical protein
MAVYLASIVSLVLAALSLGPSYAHVLEALPRLTVWPAELWRDATVFHRQFEWYALIGAPVDVAAIIAAVALAFLVRDRKPMFRPAVVGAACLAAGLASWFGFVAPANAVLATWQPGPIPADFDVIRMRWETGHMIVAAFRLFGFVMLCLAVARPLPNDVKLTSWR